MHPSLRHTAQRPYPPPRRPWMGRMAWHDLLFAHWPVRERQIREFVPEELELDMFAGSCWIGIVPFRMTDVGLRGLPPLPWLSAFPEINVRTYVTRDGRPGVWF